MARNVITSGGKAVRIEGIPEIKQKIAAILTKARAEEVKKIYMQGAMVLRNEAKSMAPYGATRVKGTHLRDAIFAAYGDPSKQNVLVGVNSRKAPHAHMVEYGTSKMAAQPYLRPAITATRPMVVRVVADGFREMIVKAADVY